ncbi:ATP-binding protein [Paramagnetospirillum magneticum]|nr:ATP-binding protein [Paramagnetospirillum magneticum]
MSQFELDNAITDLSDLPMPNGGVAAMCDALVNGWKSGHIIMYGPKGSGKTTMAGLLPKAIAPDVNPWEVRLANPAQYDARTIAQLANTFMRTIGMNSKKKSFIIFDEFGEISKVAVGTLNNALTDCRVNCMAIFITNNIDDVAPSIASRCYKADFTQVNYMNYVPYAESVLKKYGVTNVNRTALERVVKANCFDLRELMRELEDIVLKAQQNGAIPAPVQPQPLAIVAPPVAAAPIVASPPSAPSASTITPVAAAQAVTTMNQSSAATP